MPLSLYVVDAFTDRPFGGNPAGVCLLDRAWPSDRWLQLVGREVNLAETAFLVRRSAAEYDLRWFTPAVEVDLCGHATLGSAHALWENGPAPRERLTFHTKSGPLTAAPAVGGQIELDFPVTPSTACEPPAGLLDALGAAAGWVGRSCFDYLVEVGSDAEVRALRPDFRRLVALGCRGVIVTAKSADPAYDFVSRFFAPGAGIDEDPVTGSAHCCLADYWGKKLGKDEMVGFQASERGGVVRVIRRDDRVGLVGRAVLMSRGELLVKPEEG
ncbi:MAG: PhzF family phenazine biosynthesis protein [Gemmataceae bacterium]|nr:PhzF family phenazine biosynthesis protein [Gemmataceae bacterium]